MAVRSIRTARRAEGVVPPSPAAWNWAFDWGRQQMAVATEGASVLFRGFEAMRRIQEQTLRQATQRQAAVADKLRKPCDPTEMLALQAELLRSEMDLATRYWQDLADAAMEMNSQLCACSTQLVDSEDVLAVTSPPFLHS